MQVFDANNAVPDRTNSSLKNQASFNAKTQKMYLSKAFCIHAEITEYTRVKLLLDAGKLYLKVCGSSDKEGIQLVVSSRTLCIPLKASVMISRFGLNAELGKQRRKINPIPKTVGEHSDCYEILL